MQMIILILAIILFLYFVFYVSSETLYVRSDIDQNVYLIRRGNLKSQEFLKESADTLAKINVRIEKLIDILFYKYKEDPDKNYFIEMLKHNYRHDILSEAAIDTRYTTYTIDKNDMHVCLRTRDKEEKLYDVNLLMYVVLHELAHLCNYDRQKNPIQGHGKEFKDIFKFLVKEAINIGVYDYANYSEKPVEYCNILISSQIYTKS